MHAHSRDAATIVSGSHFETTPLRFILLEVHRCSLLLSQRDDPHGLCLSRFLRHPLRNYGRKDCLH